jgi:hypothetical protein
LHLPIAVPSQLGGRGRSFFPNAKVSGGALAQRYRRTETTAGQPPLWVGERNTEIVLQFETNAAHAGNGIAEIELKLTGTAA